jgi:hypothetical protein
MKYLFVICSFFIVGCASAPKIISDYNSEGFNITYLKGSEIRLFGSSNIDVLEFKKSFISEYESKEKFDSIFTSQLKESLNKLATVSIGNKADMNQLFLDQSFEDDHVAKVKEAFETAKESYFLGIKKVTISNSFTYYPQVPMAPTTFSTPGGKVSMGGGFTGGGEMEKCIVEIKAEVWSVKDKKRVIEFTSIGDKSVIFFNYGSTLKSAVKDAMTNLCNFIEKNVMK